MPAKNKAAKAKRGRPVKNVNLNFGAGRTFTVDSAMNRYNRNKSGKTISRAAVQQKIAKLVKSRKAKVVERVVKGRGHPTYKYVLVAPRAKAATPAADQAAS